MNSLPADRKPASMAASRVVKAFQRSQHADPSFISQLSSTGLASGAREGEICQEFNCPAQTSRSLPKEGVMNQKKKAKCSAASSREPRMIWLCVVAVILTTCAVLPLSATTGRLIAHNTPSYVSTAKNLGAADPSKTMEVSVWLIPHNRGQLDVLAEQLY